MPGRDTNWPAGTPCWADCAVRTDHRGAHHARDFYAKLFGWRVEDGPEEFGGYAMALKDEIPVAAITPTMNEQDPSVWTIYFATDDIDASVEAIRAAGGAVDAEPMEIPGSGHAAYCRDPEGAPFGLWQGGAHHGFGLVNEPGSFAWASLLTRDVDAAQSFYGNVFGFTFADSAGRETALVALPGGEVIGSLQQVDEELSVPVPSWNVHFAVADRDSSAAIAQEEEGHILRTFDSTGGPEAWIKSPTGETFLVIALSE